MGRPGYCYDVYDNDRPVMRCVTAREVYLQIGIPMRRVPQLAETGDLHRGRYRIDLSAGGAFRKRFGVSPEAYDRAMREFRARGKHLTARFVPREGGCHAGNMR